MKNLKHESQSHHAGGFPYDCDLLAATLSLSPVVICQQGEKRSNSAYKPTELIGWLCLSFPTSTFLLEFK